MPISQLRPDLILLDPGLADIDGKEVIREAAPPLSHLRFKLNADPLKLSLGDTAFWKITFR